MAEGRGPEEFFEVFRSVQSGRKKRDDKPEPASPATDEAETEAAPVEAGDEAIGPRVWERDVTVSFPVVVLAVLSALLVVLAAYLLGRQQGWQGHVAAQARASAPTTRARAATAAPPATVLSTEPELSAEGKVFTIVFYGPGSKNRERAEQEAKWLNAYKPFAETLKVQAYVWCDAKSRYRLCARGLKALSPAHCENVTREIRKLKSSRGKSEYDSAEFQAP